MKRAIPIFNFSIQNASNNEVDIHIDGDIVDSPTQEILKNWYGDQTSVSFKSFRDQINNSGGQVFNVYINSGGGSLIEALAMHDLLVEMQSKGKTVNTIGRGIIASAATYILMAGKSPEMSANSWLMIHNVGGVIWGNVNEIENYAATLRQFNDKARDFYASHTGIRKEEVTKMMNSETWMPADEAKEKGFVKNVTGDASFTNKISSDHWQFNDTAVLNAYNSSVTAPPDNSLATQIKNLTMKFSFEKVMNAIKGVKPAENADGQAIVNQITEAMTAPFNDLAVEIENSINAQFTEAETSITNALTESITASLTASLTASITASITAAFEARFKGVEKANEDLEVEITNKLGAGSTAPQNEGVKAIGSFNKATA